MENKINNRLDGLTDLLIGKTSETLKNSILKLIDCVPLSDEDAIKSFADMIGVGVEDVNAILDGDVALLDLATVMRIGISVGVLLRPIDVVNEDEKKKPYEKPKEGLCASLKKLKKNPHFEKMSRERLVDIQWSDDIDVIFKQMELLKDNHTKKKNKAII